MRLAAECHHPRKSALGRLRLAALSICLSSCAGVTPAPPAVPSEAERLAALDRACTPTVSYESPDMMGDGHLFALWLPTPQSTLQEASRTICHLLYREAKEVPVQHSIRLIIDGEARIAH